MERAGQRDTADVAQEREREREQLGRRMADGHDERLYTQTVARAFSSDRRTPRRARGGALFKTRSATCPANLRPAQGVDLHFVRSELGRQGAGDRDHRTCQIPASTSLRSSRPRIKVNVK